MIQRFASHSPSLSTYFREFALSLLTLLVAVSLLGSSSRAQAAPLKGRPILFVHGFCDNPASWETLRGQVISSLHSDQTLGPFYQNDQNYNAYFWGGGVYLTIGDPAKSSPLVPSQVSADVRFFSVDFYDAVENTFDPEGVALVSNLNKADELANIIQAITEITHVKDVIVVAHSMGGLVSRAYLENLASPGACYNYERLYQLPPTGSPVYDNGVCQPGATHYSYNIANLITLDTPHGGSDLATLGSLNPYSCSLSDSTTKTEMEPTSTFIQALNYNSVQVGGVTASDIDSAVGIEAIQSFLTDTPLVGTDVVLSEQTQSISNMNPAKQRSNFTNVLNPTSSTTPPLGSAPGCPQVPFTGLPILHVLPCVGSLKSTVDDLMFQIDPIAMGQVTSIGVQAMLDGNSWPSSGQGSVSYLLDAPNTIFGDYEQSGRTVPTQIYDLPTGTYTLTYLNGGPNANPPTISPYRQFLGTNLLTGINQWALNFVIAFTSSPPIPPNVQTSSATGVQGDGATLNGSAMPDGFVTTSWFDYGTSSSLANFESSPPQSVGAGTTWQPFNFGLSGLSSNTTYYYRAAASNAAGTVRSSSILSFTTLPTLAPPTLLAPSNGATGVSTSPTFSWSVVTNATSYRLIVATNPAALPTDPTSASCGSDCVLDVTPAGNSYTPDANTLSPGMTYYWQAHARSALQYGAWSGIFNFTTAAAANNDFSLQVSPVSQSVSQSGSVGCNVTSSTISGSAQSITFGANNLPSGVTASFAPPTVNSGSPANLTISASASTATGTYTILVVGTGLSAVHSVQVSLTVTASSGGPIVSITPTSQIFPDQAVGTVGSPQTLMFMNTGSGQLVISSITLAAGSDYIITQQPQLPLILNPLVPATLEVAFAPSVTGPRPGQILLWDNAPTSPQVAALSGKGLSAQPTNGTIQVNGSLNGIALPAGYGYSYTLTGPVTYTAGGAETFTVTPGTYALSFNGNPPYLTLSGITPSVTQTVAAGGVISYTMNFTAPNDFYGPYFGVPQGNGWSEKFVPAGSTGTYYISDPYPPNGNASTPLTLQVFGNPSTEVASFNPQPMYSGTSSTLTITTNPGDALGAYTLSLNATNSSGLSHPGTGTSALVITAPPRQPLQLASENSGGVQGNQASSIAPGAVSADGRYALFNSSATNLASNSFPGVFLRDMQAGTTALVSLSSSGVPADNYSGSGTISANGRYATFYSLADNLASGTIPGNTSIYVRDLQQNTTEREDVAADGTPENGSTASLPSISADGRFVVFGSTATNLVPGVSGNVQIYLRDRNTGHIKLVSVGMDGSPANQGAGAPVVSADGRFVAYFSSSTNLVSQTTGGTEVYVYDTQAGQTVLASSASDGTPAGQLVLSNYSPPALSADGRFVSFTSNATNLIPGAIDYNGDFRVFLKDLRSQAISLVDTDANGTPLARGGTEPQISADGRFIAYMLYGQVFVRDMDSNKSAVISLAPDGTPGNNPSYSDAPIINSSGTVVAFDSIATNLVANDTNNASDVFVSQSPLIGTLYVRSLTLSPSPAPGGSAVTGTVILSASAPTDGAAVVITCNNVAGEVPSFVLVPAGATRATFSFSTSLVATETVMTVIGSYNGASAVALLTLEPAPALTVAPTSWNFGGEPAGTTSAATAFSISNTGSAPLTLNSEIMASGHVFHVVANTCGASLTAGSNCSVSVVFNPAAAGSTADTLQISYGTPAVVQSVSVTGTGTTPLVSLAPAAVTFGSQPIPSATPATVTLTNVGTAPLTSIAASITGVNGMDFSISSDGCSGTVLQPNSGCLIAVVFSPQAAGPRTATLSVNDNASGSPQTVGLNGTGVVPLAVSPTASSYGNQGISSTSAAKKVTLTNHTEGAVTISSMAISGTNSADFSQSATNCGKTLALNKSCTISITFTPAALGARSATLTITDSAMNSPQTVALSGTGVLQVSLSAATFAFGNQADGSTSAPKTMTLTNNTSAVLSISSVATAGANAAEFAVSSNACGLGIGGHSSCKISVTFAPVTPGAKTAALTITDSASNSPQSVNVTGIGIAPVSVTPSSLTFAAQTVGTTSAAKIVTIKNNLPSALTMSGNTFTGANAGDFGQSATTCGTTLAAGAKCTVSITFRPAAKGSRLAVLNVADGAITSPQTVNLSGTGK